MCVMVLCNIGPVTSNANIQNVVRHFYIYQWDCQIYADLIIVIVFNIYWWWWWWRWWWWWYEDVNGVGGVGGTATDSLSPTTPDQDLLPTIHNGRPLFAQPLPSTILPLSVDGTPAVSTSSRTTRTTPLPVDEDDDEHEKMRAVMNAIRPMQPAYRISWRHRSRDRLIIDGQFPIGAPVVLTLCF